MKARNHFWTSALLLGVGTTAGCGRAAPPSSEPDTSMSTLHFSAPGLTSSVSPEVPPPPNGPQISEPIDIDAPILSGPSQASAILPSVASDGTGYMVVWTERRSRPYMNENDVWAARVSGTGELLDPVGFPVFTQGNAQEPRVAHGNGRYVVAWYDADAACTRVASILAPNGVELDDSCVPGFFQPTGIAFGLSTFLMVGGGRMLHADQDGHVLDAAPAAISDDVSSLGTDAVAFDGEAFRLAWRDTNGGINTGRVSTEMVPVGDVMSGEAGSGRPGIACNDSTCLIVHVRDLWETGEDLFGFMVDHSDQLVANSLYEVAQAPGGQRFPAVAFDGTNYVVAWQDSRDDPTPADSGTQPEDFRTTLVTPDGAVTDLGGAVVKTSQYEVLANPLPMPALASNGSASVLVTTDYRHARLLPGTSWTMDTLSANVYAYLVDGDGLPAAPEGVLVSSQGRSATVRAAFGAGDRASVAFSSMVADGHHTDTFARDLSVDGQLVQDAPVGLEVGPADAGSITGAWDGSAALFAWQEYESGTDVTRLYGVLAGGATAGLPPLLLDTAVGSVAAASDGQSFLLAWKKDSNISGQLLDQDGAPVSSPVALCQGPCEVGYLSAAFDGQRYVLVWSTSGPDSDIHGANVEVDGTPGPTFPICVEVGLQERPAIACDGGRCLVAWSDARAAQGDVYAALVDDGAVLEQGGVRLAAAADDRGFYSLSRPTVAHAAGGFLVVWADRSSDDLFDLRGTWIHPHGPLTQDPAWWVFAGEPVYETRPLLARLDETHTVLAYSRFDAAPEVRSVRPVVRMLTWDVPGGGGGGTAGEGGGGGTAGEGGGGDAGATSGTSSSPPGCACTWSRESDPPFAGWMGTLGLAVLCLWRCRRRSLAATVIGGALYCAGCTAPGGRSEPVEKAALQLSVSDHVPMDAPRYLPTPGHQFSPALAFGDTGYLAVWSDEREQSREDLYATRLSSDGYVLDPGGIRLTADRNQNTDPFLAFDASLSRYFVIWSQGDAISAMQLTVDGTPAGESVKLTMTGIYPSVALGDAGPFAVWREGGDIKGCLVTDEVLHVPGSACEVHTLGTGLSNGNERPEVAWGPGAFLVTWTADSTSVRGVRVTAEGSVVGAPDTDIFESPPGVEVRAPAVIGTGNGWVIAWGAWYEPADGMPSSSKITNLFVNEQGMAVGGVHEVSRGGRYNERPRMVVNQAALPHVWLTTWVSVDDFSVGSDIHAVRVSPDTGEPIEVDDLVVCDQPGSQGSTSGRETALVCGADGSCLAAWWDARNLDTRYDVFGILLDSNAMADQSTYGPIAQSANRQTAPAVASDPGPGANRLFVTWEDLWRGDKDSADVHAAVLKEDGKPISGDYAKTIPVSAEPPAEATPAVAFNGTHYLVVWQDARFEPTAPDIYGMRFERNGEPFSELIPIAVLPGAQSQPQVASNGQDFYVVWVDAEGGMPRVRGRQVLSTGMMSVAVPFGDASHRHSWPAIAHGESPLAGSSYLVVWQDHNQLTPPLERIVGVKVDGATGQPSNDIPITIADPAKGDAERPSLAYGNDGWLATFRSQDGLSAVRVSAESGTLSESDIGETFVVSSQAGGYDRAAVAWADVGYFLTWEAAGEKEDTTDLFAARVDGKGELLDRLPFPIASELSDERAPAATRLSCGEVFLSYQHRFLTYPWGDIRVFGRVISFGGSRGEGCEAGAGGGGAGAGGGGAGAGGGGAGAGAGAGAGGGGASDAVEYTHMFACHHAAGGARPSSWAWLPAALLALARRARTGAARDPRLLVASTVPGARNGDQRRNRRSRTPRRRRGSGDVGSPS